MTNHQGAARLGEIERFAAVQLEGAAGSWSMGQTPDPGLFVQAATLGLFGMEIPAEDGGLALSFSFKARVARLLAASDFGFAMSVINTHNVAARMVKSAPLALRDRYLPLLLSGNASACTALTEPEAGSDFAAIQTRAVRTPDGWLLEGEKSWIVNARHARLAIVYAHCSETMESSGSADIGAFLVDLESAGVRRYALDAAFAQTSMGTGGFILDGVRLTPDSLLLAPGSAFKAILDEINAARTYVAAMCCGMLSAALRQAGDYGARRHTFAKPLEAHQAWRLRLAQAATGLAAAEALVSQTVAQISLGQDAQLQAAQAKIHAVQACEDHLPALLHAMGAEGLKPQYCFTRHIAAMHLAALTDGSTNMLLERVARLARTRSNPQTG